MVRFSNVGIWKSKGNQENLTQGRIRATRTQGKRHAWPESVDVSGNSLWKGRACSFSSFLLITCVCSSFFKKEVAVSLWKKLSFKLIGVFIREEWFISLAFQCERKIRDSKSCVKIYCSLWHFVDWSIRRLLPGKMHWYFLRVDTRWLIFLMYEAKINK